MLDDGNPVRRHEVHVKPLSQNGVILLARKELHAGPQTMMARPPARQAPQDTRRRMQVVGLDHSGQTQSVHGRRVAIRHRVHVGVGGVIEGTPHLEGLGLRGRHRGERVGADEGDLRLGRRVGGQGGELGEDAAGALVLLKQDGGLGLVQRRTRAEPENRQRRHEDGDQHDQPIVTHQGLEDLAQTDGVVGVGGLAVAMGRGSLGRRCGLLHDGSGGHSL